MSGASGPDRIKIKVDPDLADLIPEFLERRKQDVTQLLKAVAQKDIQTIMTIGHQMKGSGSGYGFDWLTELGEAIENEALAGRFDKIPALSASLADYLNRLELSYE